METTCAAVVTLADFESGILMVALRHPTGHARFEVGVWNQIGSAGREDFDIIHQTFARTEQDDLERICRAAAVIEQAGKFNVLPGAL